MSRVPSATETERAVLGAMLLSPEASEEVAALLEPEDFFSEQHQRVFKAAKALNEDGLVPNVVSVQERTGLQRSDLDLMVECGHVTVSQLRTLVAETRRVSDLRTVFYTCSDAVKSINKEVKIEEILERVEQKLYRLDRAGSAEAKDGADVVRAQVADFLERVRLGGGQYLSTGIKALDKAIIGMRPGKMGVIAGRPGMGKTALTSSIRRNVVGQPYPQTGQKTGVVEFNLEMTAEELIERELSFKADLPLRKIMAAQEITEEELERVRGAAGAYDNGLWVIDDSTYSITGIRRRARIAAGRMARQGVRLGLVILDYIQLAGDNGDGREQSVAAISRGCKLMAKELGCTVLALSQLNRSCELRDDRRPLLSDLRESGTIEQDADWVAFVYREHQYDSSVPPEEAELIIRKQRSGPTGTVRLHYNARLVTFGDVPCEHQKPLPSGSRTANESVPPPDVPSEH
jgi:replicative DNA helicase